MINRSYDKPFLVISIVLVLFGLFILSSASLGVVAKEGNFLQHISRQFILGLGLGGILFVVGIRTPYKFWHKFSLSVFLLSVATMLLIYEPHLGFIHAGARRWLDFGYFFFQPSEFLKFGLIVYLAAWIVSKKENISSFKSGLIPFVIILAFVSLLLILQPDIGTLGVMIITALFMFFIGQARKSHLAGVVLLGIMAVTILVAFTPYRLSRFQIFLNPDTDLRGAGYQLHQSFIAIGSGGLWGRGFGKSIQKFNYLPESTGDSIFAVLAEEFGFLGTLFLIIAFLFFLWRGLKIAKRTPDTFGRLLASGIVILIVVQSLIHMSALSGLLPLTGLPLIFISQGGTSLAISLLMVGVVLNISKS